MRMDTFFKGSYFRGDVSDHVTEGGTMTYINVKEDVTEDGGSTNPTGM